MMDIENKLSVITDLLKRWYREGKEPIDVGIEISWGSGPTENTYSAYVYPPRGGSRIYCDNINEATEWLIGYLTNMLQLSAIQERLFRTKCEMVEMEKELNELEEVLRGDVTLAEALRIAREILDQAERERLVIAEYEAARGIQWENHP